ncbi:MAG TPA: YbaK/EbsC family protein [Patescibacteria group bacterium]|nr:YbaK/EbsC family protein [Patescibacteria group bacterium]
MPLQRVQAALENYKDLEIILFDSSTHTADLAAQALGVQPAQIAKSLLFLADGQPAMVVTCGDRKVNTKLFGRLLSAKKVRFANAEQVAELTGFPPGGVSPVGLLRPLPVYLDKSLYDYAVVYAAAGTANSALPVAPERLREITGAEIIDVCS